MSGKVFKIVSSLDSRLKQGAASLTTVNFAKSGIVFGFNTAGQPNESYVLGCAASEDDLPAGTTMLGAFFLGEGHDEASIIEHCAALAKSKKSGKLLVLQALSETPETVKAQTYDIKSKKLAECSSEIVDSQEVMGSLVDVSLDAALRLKVSYYSEKFTETVAAAFGELKESLGDASFQLSGSELALSSESADELAVEDLYSQIEQFDELADVQIPANMKKKMIEKMQRKLKSDKEALKFTLNNGETVPETDDGQAPIELSEGRSIDLVIPIRVHLFVQLANQTSFLFKAFTSLLSKVLSHFERALLANATDSSGALAIPQVFTFFEPTTFCHPIVVVYGNTADQEAFRSAREALHLRYIISLDRPTFKTANRIGWGRPTKDSSLANVHLGLSSGLKHGQPVTVSGRYLYFHYNQQGVSDSGWGCAYRSLQTIVSWFQLQGYLDSSVDRVPSHRAIQQALVDVGDKPASFVGSSKWIGSQEVCYVLSQLYQIESKIIFVSSGAELANKGRELMAHFARHGTPIMIGGGVLAHTIIGVHFDETTGDIKFLILDPHFTGDDDLSVIQKKGWCGWKPLSFWDKNAFYNLCLPQKPITF
ncbi:PREDICTED: ufm1-specific protease 2-like [Rhagoletis zephyria]|uniref:ufm1-specific protease 2-like n=1 Tax=Rhagoletis zephyria TaxID=28612 RepID=UPI0008119FBE|nr:PREDICTED: ufm1-specific protease 2-like [Rhagoletis zephyria]KAH9400657.1 Ufm1-specific protease 2 [Tyrophagus putrescentiae]